MESMVCSNVLSDHLRANRAKLFVLIAQTGILDVGLLVGTEGSSIEETPVEVKELDSQPATYMYM